jgi:hypothetical protein
MILPFFSARAVKKGNDFFAFHLPNQQIHKFVFRVFSRTSSRPFASIYQLAKLANSLNKAINDNKNPAGEGPAGFPIMSYRET